MNYADPRKEVLSVTYNNETYNVTYYKTPSLLTGVTDENYPIWNGASVDVGEYVIVPELKKIYRSTASANTSFPPSDNTKWTDYGPVNSMKMFATDEHIGSKTVGTDVVMEFDFSQADVISCIDIDFTKVSIEITNNDTGETSEPIIEDGYDIGTYDIGDLFYTDKKNKYNFVTSGLEWFPNSKIKLTFTGEVSIGTTIYGNEESLFATLWGTSLDFQSESKFLVSDITGWRTVLRYGAVKVLDVQVAFDTNDFDVIAEKINPIIDRNVLWIPMPKDRFTSTITIGYLERIKLPLDNPARQKTTARIIGVNKK